MRCASSAQLRCLFRRPQGHVRHCFSTFCSSVLPLPSAAARCLGLPCPASACLQHIQCRAGVVLLGAARFTAAALHAVPHSIAESVL